MRFLMGQVKDEYFVVSDAGRVRSAQFAIRSALLHREAVPTHFVIDGVRVPVFRNRDTAVGLLNRKNTTQ